MRLYSHGVPACRRALSWIHTSTRRQTSSWNGDSSTQTVSGDKAASVSRSLSAQLKARHPNEPHINAVSQTLSGGLWTSEPPPKKKKSKKKKKKNVETVTSEAANQPGSKSDVEPETTLEGWSGEDWKEDWGEDKLQPRSDYRNPPPHMGFPVAYSRRIEGLLEDTPKTALETLEAPTPQSSIAQLHHGLERVLFNPGVHWLRDPRSRVYNFPPSLGIIPKVVDFAFDRLTGFIRSSRDTDLWTLAKREGRKFTGSTSSLSGMLCHIYFLLSQNKTVDTSTLSSDFRREPPNFTPGQRMAASVIFNYKDGVYSIDSDSKQEEADKNILLWMGTLLEKYLTMPSEEFLTYTRSHPQPEEQNNKEPAREAYRYSKSEKFVLRSQLDCQDTRLPGTGVFDIKTRACLPIRMDILNFEQNSGYLIRQNQGLEESFEREYYDLIRSAFLKYQFQARIGDMDGVFVAYHNTARMFGFQYVPLQEMDERLFGKEPGTGNRVFQKCIEMLELVAEEIAKCFPGQSVRCTFETQESFAKDMNVWVEPVEWTPTSNPEAQDQGNQERPIRQISVGISNFCGNHSAKGSKALTTMAEPWTVHWSITHHASDPARDQVVRAGLQAAKAGQFRAHSLPSGVTPDTIEEWWDSLDFSGSRIAQVPLTPIDGADGEGIEVDTTAAAVRGARAESFFEDNFVSPDIRIRRLRKLANKGRRETVELGLEDRGKPKEVLGVGQIEWEDTLAEAEIVAQAQRDAAAQEAEALRATEAGEARRLAAEVEASQVEQQEISAITDAHALGTAFEDDLLTTSAKSPGEVSDSSAWTPSSSQRDASTTSSEPIGGVSDSETKSNIDLSNTTWPEADELREFPSTSVYGSVDSTPEDDAPGARSEQIEASEGSDTDRPNNKE